MSVVVELRDVTKTYKAGEVDVPVLLDAALTLRAGEYVAIMGRSGSGKSTLLNILGLLDRPSSGRYLFEGHEVSGLSDDERSRLRGRVIGFVFQRFHLLSNLDVMTNVELPMRYQPIGVAARRARAKELLERVGLGHRLHHRPHQLSGGEQQRVAVARSLVNHPRLLLADEPTGNLDSAAQQRVLSLFGELRSELGLTVVLVTHDPSVGKAADRCVEVVEGRCHGAIDA